jgi:hypothetical protein
VRVENAGALGEAPEDPLQFFSVLYGIWVGYLAAFDGDVVRKLADEFLALAEKQAATVPRMIGHRMVAYSSLVSGEITEALSHYDQALALYDPAEHRALSIQFVLDARVASLIPRAVVRWLLGYRDAAIADAGRGPRTALVGFAAGFGAWAALSLAV